MPARTGNEFLRQLHENQGEVWIDGERVRDVTTHPALSPGLGCYQ